MGHGVDYAEISVKTPDEIAMLRVAGGISARVLEELTPHIRPGVTSMQINDIAHDLIVNKYGAEIDREDLSGYDSSEYAAVYPSRTTRSRSAVSRARFRCGRAICSASTSA